MNFLLDTHTIIWFITKDASLPNKTKVLIEDKNNRCLASIASLWEMGIKESLGRLKLKITLERLFKIIEESGFEFLPVSLEHILEDTKLEFHHRDPFDRMLIAQAKIENLTVVTKDPQFDFYKIKTLWQV